MESTIASADERAQVAIEETREASDEATDRERERVDGDGVQGKALMHTRDLEDEELRQQRAAVDDDLKREQEETISSLRKLLPLEREKTDRFLLTERVRADESVSHRDDFLGIVSHDVRNLLGGIVISAGLLARAAPAGEAGATIVAETDRLKRYVARMNRLIGDLVDVASMDAGKLSVHAKRGDLRALLDEAIDMFLVPAKRKDIHLTLTVGADVADGHFDHDRLIQVFANLLSNAVKFCPDHATVNLSASRVGGDFLFATTDSGPGIAGPMLEQIFDRFWQAGKSDRRGLGLGLYISRCIVESHGGRIWAESTPGGGSTFFFTLPAMAHT